MVRERAAVERLADLEREREAIIQSLDTLKERLQEIDAESRSLKAGIVRIRPTRGSAASAIPEAAYQLLQEHGTPLHYREIYERIVHQFFTVPGTAPLANLAVQMNRDHRFVKSGRGRYALREWKVKLVNGRKAPASPPMDGLEQARDREKTMAKLQAIEVEIRLAQANLMSLRRLAKEGSDTLGDRPVLTIHTVKERLARLLKLRDSLRSRIAAPTEGGTDD